MSSPQFLSTAPILPALLQISQGPAARPFDLAAMEKYLCTWMRLQAISAKPWVPYGFLQRSSATDGEPILRMEHETMPPLGATNMPPTCVLRCAIWCTSPLFSLCQDFFFFLHNSKYQLIKIRKEGRKGLLQSALHCLEGSERWSGLRSILVYWWRVCQADLGSVIRLPGFISQPHP